jgi:ABC-type microcin C transport system duplicated ATPase subunit YejF
MYSNRQPFLEVKDLKTYFYTEDGVVKAVDGVDFHVYPGEVMGLVESAVARASPHRRPASDQPSGRDR